MAGKAENKKIEEYENENFYLLRDKRHLTYTLARLSDEDNSADLTVRTDNFVNVQRSSALYFVEFRLGTWRGTRVPNELRAH